MAINVDEVYKTVLLILNKEQRGYITPDEFNKVATQVQLETFEKYFEDENQQWRVNENDTEYANRLKNVDDKISVFKTSNVPGAHVPATPSTPGYFPEPTDLYRIGTVIYKGSTELQRVQPNELLFVQMSDLTTPTTDFPVYTYEGNKLYVYPDSIIDPTDITVTYLKKPADVVWSYYIHTATGGYVYNDGVPPGVGYTGPFPASGSVDFELHPSEQTDVIIKILMYSGVVIRDPQIIQIAAGKVKQEEVRETL